MIDLANMEGVSGYILLGVLILTLIIGYIFMKAYGG